MEREELTEIITGAISDLSRVDVDEHYAHHQFIREYIEVQKLKSERWEKIKTQFFGWGLIVIVGSIGKFVFDHVGFKGG